MKKIVSLMLALLMLCSLCACGKITGIFLSQETLELEADGTATLQFTVVPENANTSKVSWKSADENIATVDGDGNVSAVSPGTTTIICSTKSGVMATCEVTVKEISAIKQLNENELMFYNLLVNKVLPSFYNASAMRLRALYSSGSESTPALFYADVQGTNKLGGTLFKTYTVMLTDENKGFFIECVNEPDKSVVFDSSVIDYVKINAALEEYWAGNGVS